MINNFKKIGTSTLAVSMLVYVFLCFSCEDTDLVETYDKYVPESVVSLATPDSVAAVATAYNKMLFKVFVNSDPKIKKAVITVYDDDESDDDDKIVATIDINRTVYQPEIYEVELDLEEGGVEYFVYLEDSEGNESIEYDVFGTTLGETYKASLSQREYSEILGTSDSEATIYWASNRTTNDDGDEIVVDDLLVKTEITYTSSVDGSEQTIVVDESEDETIIPNYISEGTFTYTTFYTAVVDSPYYFESNSAEGMFPVKL
jgi:hypothetical protein